MAYPFQNYQQPFPYQDQLNQLRSAPIQMPYQYGRPDPSGINWVQGEAGAKSWIVTPGATVLLMDSEAQRFYVKTADQSGIPTMRVFTYSEVMPDRPQEAPQPDKFVTVEEFSGFKRDVLGKLEDLAEAGKKKGDANEQPTV